MPPGSLPTPVASLSTHLPTSHANTHTHTHTQTHTHTPLLLAVMGREEDLGRKTEGKGPMGPPNIGSGA